MTPAPVSPARDRRIATAALVVAGLLLCALAATAVWAPGPLGDDDPGSVAVEGGGWSVRGDDTPPQALGDLRSLHIVPGDTLTLTTDVRIDPTGSAVLSLDTSRLTAPAVSSFFDVSLEIPALRRHADDGDPAGYRVSADDAGVYPAVITVAFDPSTSGRAAAGSSLDLGAIRLSLGSVGR